MTCLRICTGASTSGRQLQVAPGSHGLGRQAARRRGRTLTASAAGKGKGVSKRNAGLYELDSDGWGVQVSPPPPAPSAADSAASKPATASPRQRRASKKRQQAQQQQQQQQQPPMGREGLISMAMLQQSLEAAGQEPLAPEDLARIKQQMSLEAGSKPRSKVPGMAGDGQLRQQLQELRAQHKASNARRLLDEEDLEDEELGDDDGPAFQLTLGEDGAEFIDFTGSEEVDSSAELTVAEAGDMDMFGWEQFGAADGEEEEEEGGAAQGTSSQEERQLSMLKDLGGEDDWGLEGLEEAMRSRSSLIQELMAEEKQQREEGLGLGDQVLWGGTGGVTGIDLEEQEALLSRYFRPDKVKQLMKDQRLINDHYSDMKKRSAGALPQEHRLHRELRIISGSAAGKRLLSSRGAQTRPMMDKVRQAVFNSVLSWAGSVNVVPPGSRWLDLFAGTGSVGLEALSRGAEEAHFVEMDPWVTRKILSKNIATCGFTKRAITHTSKAEEFLRRARELPSYAGGAFDFISVCPPYLLVSYPELYELLEGSPLIHGGSIVFVEFPKQLLGEVRDSIGPLEKVRQKQYGRTWVAMYASRQGRGEEDGQGGTEGDAAQVSALLSG